MAKVVVNLSEVKADLHNNSLYCVPGLAALTGRASGAPLSSKVKQNVRLDVRTQRRTIDESLNTQEVRHDRNHSNKGA